MIIFLRYAPMAASKFPIIPVSMSLVLSSMVFHVPLRSFAKTFPLKNLPIKATNNILKKNHMKIFVLIIFIKKLMQKKL